MLYWAVVVNESHVVSYCGSLLAVLCPLILGQLEVVELSMG